MSWGQSIAPRAGFWRRLVAFTIIDVLVVALPFTTIAAVLFAATSGLIQFQGESIVSLSVPAPVDGIPLPSRGGIPALYSCEKVRPPPEGLTPSPPANANFARECRTYVFFVAETARYLQVGRVQEGVSTAVVSRSYMLDKTSHPINGVSIDWLMQVIFIIYLFSMEARSGATLGDRLMRIQLVDSSDPVSRGVPLRKIVIRYLTMVLGFVPMIAVLLVHIARYGQNPEESIPLTWLLLAGFLTLAWYIVIVVQIVMKRDPLYDIIAGTAVLRV